MTALLVLLGVVIGGLIAIAAVAVARRNHSGLGEESVSEILGYGPPLWPMGPTNGHVVHEPEDLEEQPQ